MRNIKTDQGWDQVTTKKIILDNSFGLHKPFLLASDWVNTNAQSRGAKGCAYCKTKWDKFEPSTKTYLIHSNCGNQVLCENCVEIFKEIIE